MRIAFLTSIYPAHAEKIYRDNPSLKNKSSEEQMEFIRWHALSSYVRWFEFFEEKGYQVCIFNKCLPEVELAWSRENRYKPKTNHNILEIGIEKIKRFKPDIIFTFSPLLYTQSYFLMHLITILHTKPKLLAWYGANCGDEEIFRFFDLTLSNSKHLVNSLRQKDIKADFLQHAFDPIILDKIKLPEERLNRVAFFGNLDVSTNDFRDRTRILEKISIQTNFLDVYGVHTAPSVKETSKYSLLKVRQKLSSYFNQIIPNSTFNYWSNEKNLPPSPWSLNKNFCTRIKPPLYGQEMLQKLSSYQIALNDHNKHTGDNACNMRLYEATGLGCCLVTDEKSDLYDLFERDSEILTYKSSTEAISIINYLIENKNEARRSGNNGQKRTIIEDNTKNSIALLVSLINKL